MYVLQIIYSTPNMWLKCLHHISVACSKVLTFIEGGVQTHDSSPLLHKWLYYTLNNEHN